MARKQNLRGEAYALLRKRMMEGEIDFATRLLDHEIAEQLGVSRMPVREALLQLQNEGYLESTTRGFRLRHFAPLDLAQVFEIRLLLEPHAAKDGCRAATMQGLGEMRVALQDVKKADHEGAAVKFVHAGWRFRKAWLEMSSNPHLIHTLDRLRDLADLARVSALHKAEVRALSVSCMEKIFDAFVHHDAERASSSIEEHLRLCGAAYYAEQVELLRMSEGR